MGALISSPNGSGKLLLSPNSFLEVLETADDVSSALAMFEGELEDKQEQVDFWRSRIGWFREEYDLKSSYGRRAGRIRLEHLYDFLEHYRESGKNLEAAKLAGISWAAIKRRITKGDKLFLPDFYYAYEAACDELKTGLRDMMYEKAKDGDDANQGSMTAAKYVIDMLDKKEENKAEKTKIRPVNVLIHSVTERAGLTGKVVEVS